MSAVTVRTRFEAGHRLPQLDGKCQNLHGHSWQAWITVDGQPDADTGVVCDFSAVKSGVDAFTHDYWDHAMLLATSDPYAKYLVDDRLRVYLFGTDEHTGGLDWPTVENVAEALARVTETVLTTGELPARLVRVVVAETENNQATVTRP